MSDAALPGLTTGGLSKLLEWEVWTCTSEKLVFTLMKEQCAHTQCSPAHLQVRHTWKGEHYPTVCPSNILSLLYSWPSVCSVPYLDALGSGSIERLLQSIPPNAASHRTPLPCCLVLHLRKQYLGAFYMPVRTRKSLEPFPFWPFKVLPKTCYDFC